MRKNIESLESRTLFANFTAASAADLIAQINAANLTPEADTITLAAGKTFSLNAVNNTTDGATGLPLIASAGGSLTILGNGDTIERSSATGTPAFRLFDVPIGASLTLKNLTLQGGLATGGWDSADGRATPAQGGAILSRGTLTLDGVVVQNNTAQGNHGAPWAFMNPLPGGDAEGGGVFSSGMLAVSASTIRNNSALGGGGSPGGWYNYGDGNVRWSATPGGSTFGGGVCVADGSALFTASFVSANTARGGDGGSADASSYTVGNGGDGLGGGVYIGSVAKATLRNVIITTNSAIRGVGGIGGSYTSNGVPGEGVGGGIYVAKRGSLSVDASTLLNVTQNSASTSSPNIAGSYKRLR